MSRRRRYWTALKETIEWRLIAVGLDFAILWIASGKPVLAVGLASASFVVKSAVFYAWRVWHNR